MLPPLQFVGPANDPYSLAIVDDAAPLSRWLPMMTFKTLQECDNFSLRLARNMRKSVKTERDKKDVETLIGIWLGKYQCVARRMDDEQSKPTAPAFDRLCYDVNFPHQRLHAFQSATERTDRCTGSVLDSRQEMG
jgi:hypothetical protein